MRGGLSFGPAGLERPSAGLGVKFILLYHFLENAAFLALSLGDLVIFRSPSLRLTSKYSSRLAVAGYALLGIPLIGAALWGVARRAEKPLRCYWFYLVVSAVVNVAYTIDAVVHFLPCAAGRVPSAPEASIFQCGQPRGVVLTVLFFVVGFQLTMLYPVHTYCEDLKWDSEGPEQRARAGKSTLPTRRLAVAVQWAMLREGPLDHIHGCIPGEYGSISETAAVIGASGVGTGVRLPYLPATRLV